MESKKWMQGFLEQNQQCQALMLKKFETVFQQCQELRKKKSHHVSVVENIATLKSQTQEEDTTVVKVAKESKEFQKKNAELKYSLKNEKLQTDNMKSEMKDIQDNIIEHEKMMRDVQDKVNVLLKPYHETLGITIEKCKGPEKNSVRIIFRTPSSKTCQVKLGNVDNRIKIVKCVPSLSGIKAIEDKLNQTNDFPGFITHVHSLFMKSSSH